MSPRLLRAVVTIASLAMGLALAEAVLHIVRPAVAYPYEPQRIAVSHFQASSYLPFELRPHHTGRFRMNEFDTTVQTNDLGLRDDAVRADREHLLCLGDSFTFGFGVEGPETFCAQLERAFQGKYDVVNAGFADGNAPDTYALWLTRHRQAVAPRAIVVSLFQNDYDDITSHEWLPAGAMPPQRIIQPGTIVTEDGEWMRGSAIARLPRWARVLLKQSYLVAIIRDRWLDDAGGPGGEPGSPSAADAQAPADARFLAALELLHGASAGTPLVVHLIPNNGQQTPSRMDALAADFARRHGLPLVQRYAVFSSADYFARDGHWVASGHTKAAEYLHDTLTSLGYE